MMYKEHTIVVVDDHLLIAKAIAGIIDQFDGFRVLYEAEDGKRVVEKFSLPQNVPDIVLLDISMQVMDGFETAQWISQHQPAVKIVALTMQDDEKYLLKMIENGACSYLQKNIHPAELRKALEQIVNEGFYYPAQVTRKLLRTIAGESKKEKNEINITDREKEFLTYVCTDLTYREIAEKMFCSPRTIESYRDALFEKLNVKSRVALALYAVKTGYYQI